jgi:hypothetical protein
MITQTQHPDTAQHNFALNFVIYKVSTLSDSPNSLTEALVSKLPELKAHRDAQYVRDSEIAVAIGYAERIFLNITQIQPTPENWAQIVKDCSNAAKELRAALASTQS